MAITNAGRDYIAAAVVSSAAQTAFNSANAFIGVGSGNTGYNASQSILVSALTSGRKGMDASYPSVSGNVMTFRSTFVTTEANGAWEEWAVFNGSSSGTMLNRKQETLGTKTSAQTWQFTVTITLTIP